MTNLVFIQANGLNPTVNVSSAQISFSLNTTTGSYLLAYCLLQSTGSTTLLDSVTDTLGNVWSVLFTDTNLTILQVPSNKIGGGANTLTFNFSAAAQTFIGLGIVEYTGQNPFSPVDNIVKAVGGTGTSYVGAPITTHQTNETVVSFGFMSGNKTMTGTGGWTSRYTSSQGAGSFGVLDAPATSVGIYTPTTNVNLSSSFAFNTIAIKSTSSMFPYWSEEDCRNYSIFPNNAVDVQGTETYTVPAHPSRSTPVDSRKHVPVDSRVSFPTNSRTAPPFES